MGRGFAEALRATHEVILGSRDPERGRRVAAKTGAAGSATYADAAVNADVVILAVPWATMEETLAALGDLQDTVVVDVSFPINKQQREALKGRSSAEVVQKRLPGARVVKGWNHVHSPHLTAPEVGGIAASVLLAGEDADAKKVVSRLARDMGFHPVDVGPLRATRDLEKLVGTMLFVRLGPIRVLSAPG